MMNLSLNVAGINMRVDYASVSVEPRELVVGFDLKDNNRTEFKVIKNPENIPEAVTRIVIRSIHEQLMRSGSNVPNPMYILMEKSDV